jgi:hypothetical protein
LISEGRLRAAVSVWRLENFTTAEYAEYANGV